MKVELILPIARLRGKINSSSPFYFKTVNGKTFVQRCPNRSTTPPDTGTNRCQTAFRRHRPDRCTDESGGLPEKQKATVGNCYESL